MSNKNDSNVTDMVEFKNRTNLVADPASLKGLGTAVATMAQSGSGDDFLRLLREGLWVFGAENTEIEKESQWAINPYSFQHGFICWGDKSNVLGEVMVPVTQPLPVQSELPEQRSPNKDGVDTTWKWDDQLAFQLQCQNGEDSGIQVLYKVTSVGGKRAVGALATAIAARASAGETALIPLISLGMDSYQHKQYGKIWTPEFEVNGWLTPSEGTGDGGDEQENVTESEPEATPPPRRTRRSRTK